SRQDDDELERQQRGPVHVRSVVQQHGLRTRGPGLDQRQPTERTHVLGILGPRGHDGQLQLDMDRPGSRELSPQHRRPSEVSDTANDLGSAFRGRVVSGNSLYLRLGDMPSLQTWSFTVTASAATNLVPGSTLVNVVSLNYTNLNGFLLPPRVTTWAVLVSAPD